MLLHVQNPRSTFVATASDWETRFGRKPKEDARPLVILKPFGPVSFVFDISDIEGDPFPEQFTDPFHVQGSVSEAELKRLIHNLQYNGIAYEERVFDSYFAGYLETYDKAISIQYRDKEMVIAQPFRMVVNRDFDATTKVATIYHELAHLFCGHLPNKRLKQIPERYMFSYNVKEFEAESVCWILCERHGIQSPSAAYLSHFLEANDELPDISVETVLKAAGRIEAIYDWTGKPVKDIIIC